MVVIDLWDAIGLQASSVVACTGAGGKTSAIQSVAVCARLRNLPVLVSTTTKMFYNQVASLNPIFCHNFANGLESITAALAEKQVTAWFTRREVDKVIGLRPEWIDRLQAAGANAVVLLEADGAQGRWVKAPAVHEPVVPACTTITVGILNLQAIGSPLSECVAHRTNELAGLLKKQVGDIISWHDLALLASHEHGIFQYSRGLKVLLLAGASSMHAEIGEQISEYLRSAQARISRCIVTEGYGQNMRPVGVFII